MKEMNTTGIQSFMTAFTLNIQSIYEKVESATQDS